MFNLFGSPFKDLYSAGWRSVVPAQKLVPVVKNNDEDLPNGPCRCIWAGDDGTVNLVMVDGSELNNFPLFAGMNAIACARVKEGGTLTQLWAVY